MMTKSDKVLQLWLAGLNTLEIAKVMGVHESKIYNMMHAIRWRVAMARHALKSSRAA